MTRWRKTLNLADVFHGDQPFAERRDIMVGRIRALDPNHNDGELQDIADELAEAETPDEWDVTWDAFYDWADWSDVWVRTR